MRYFTLEQRESLRNALTSHAVKLREQISGHPARFIAQAPIKDVSEETLQLRRVEETLARLRSPDFGVCKECHGDIPYSLLKTNPFTNLCGQCLHRGDLALFIPGEL